MAQAVMNPEALAALKGGCPMMVHVFLLDFSTINLKHYLQSRINITELDADRDFKPYIPPIVPKGTYKVSLHFYNINKTLIDIEAIADVRQIGLSDFISLG